LFLAFGKKNLFGLRVLCGSILFSIPDGLEDFNFPIQQETGKALDMKTCFLLLFLSTLCFFIPSSLFAARPLFTEDTETPGKGAFELELGFDTLQEDNWDINYIPSAQ
jgi:hypothetical protein